MVVAAFYWRQHGDPATGRLLAQNNCGVCHDLTDKKVNERGPYLWGIVGRPAGAAVGFHYSDAFIQRVQSHELHWTEQSLEQLLDDPTRFMPNIAMTQRKSQHALAFEGMQLRDNRRDLIAFLKTLR
ncbi:MAG: c-type cytochrome [Magnetococcales bacterium]|nr:c-type cytochrome [Magnetococcales bacterium]